MGDEWQDLNLFYAMDAQPFILSIIIPTRNRVQILTQLLQSIGQLDGLDRIRPDVIVTDNNSRDDTYDCVNSTTKDFPAPLRIIRVERPGKSAAANDAVKSATSDLIAFLDDDVVVDKTWLMAVESFFQQGKYCVGQGRIRLQSPANDDPEILKLVHRYRTIPQLEYDAATEALHSLNGANIFMHREIFNRVGGFDERLGPGASGTSEDVDLARRLAQAGITIGYAPQAVVYHRVDRSRLTEGYFKDVHRRQGASRYLFRRRSTIGIAFRLIRTICQFCLFALIGKERQRYRCKGRIFHYLGMIEAKRNRIRHEAR
jgi:glucosyl-dolichyl phosphate glucuronosyltransferase